MTKILTKEEIEKFGFIYETDVTKCKTAKTGPHFDCNYYMDGIWTHQSQSELTEEYKVNVVENIKLHYPSWKYINSVFVPNIEPRLGRGVMCRFVMITGHL